MFEPLAGGRAAAVAASHVETEHHDGNIVAERVARRPYGGVRLCACRVRRGSEPETHARGQTVEARASFGRDRLPRRDRFFSGSFFDI